MRIAATILRTRTRTSVPGSETIRNVKLKCLKNGVQQLGRVPEVEPRRVNLTSSGESRKGEKNNVEQSLVGQQ